MARTSANILMASGPAPSGRAPAERKIDAGQLRALVGLYLKLGTRMDPSAARRTKRPLITLIWSMLLMGYLFSVGKRYLADLDSYLIVMFTTVFGIVMMGIIPDSNTIRERNLEILHSKPINERTHVAAYGITRLFYTWLIASSFAAIPLIRAKISFHCSWGTLAGNYLVLVLASFSLLALWLSLIMYFARWFNIERFRKAARYTNLAIMLTLMVASLSVLTGGDAQLIRPISLAAMPAIKFTPPSWFVTLLSGDFHLASNLQRAGAALIFCAAFYASWSPGSAKYYYAELVERLTAVGEQPVRPLLIVKLLTLVGRIPLVGKYLVRGQVLAVASMILASAQREEISRLRIIGPRLLVTLFFVVALFNPTVYLLFFLNYCGFSSIAEGARNIGLSSHAPASWVFKAAPIEAGQLRRGIRLAVFADYFALPGVLSGFMFYWIHTPAIATILTAGFFAEAGMLLSLFLIVKPKQPLSESMSSIGSFTSFIIGAVFNCVNVALYFFLTISLGAYGIVSGALIHVGQAVAAVGLIALLLVCFLLGRWAEARLSEMESAH